MGMLGLWGTTAHDSTLAYTPVRVRPWWNFVERFFVEIPQDVQRRLAIAKAAQGIAAQLAPLEPEANREILYRVAEILGVLNDKEVKAP